MVKFTVRAVFDGEVFIPKEPLDLPPGTDVMLTITPLVAQDEASGDKAAVETVTLDAEESEDLDDENRYSFFRFARSLNLDGPPDFSARVDDYLYGDLSLDDYFEKKKAEGEPPVKPS